MKNYQRALELAEGLDNPAWDFVKPIPHDSMFDFRAADGDEPGIFRPEMMDMTRIRTGRAGPNFKFYRSYVTSRWAWAIPSPDAIARIITRLDGRPVVEIGAGNGYWAWLLSQAGVDVVAYDIAPVGHEHSWFHASDETEEQVGRMSGFEVFEPEEFFPVKIGGPEVLALPENADRALFLCWPSMSSFAVESVRAHQGDLVIYIGEGGGGCNADPDFFWTVGDGCQCWDPAKPCTHEGKEPAVKYEAEYHQIVQWSGLHDNLVFYARKG